MPYSYFFSVANKIYGEKCSLVFANIVPLHISTWESDMHLDLFYLHDFVYKCLFNRLFCALRLSLVYGVTIFF